MATLRAAVARDRAAVSDSDTFELDLRGFSSISAIDVIVRSTNGSTNNQATYIHADVDTIEVVDGSQVIYSLSGVQARSLNCYEMGHYPAVTYDEDADNVQQELFRIHFGRKLGDMLYWLDPSQFRNPVLRVTVSMTISATVSFVTNTTTITAIVYTWDERPPSRRGAFLTKEYKSFTSVASGDDRGNLPRDFPYRMIVLRAFENQIEFHTDITQIKVTADTDRFIPIDVRAEQLRDLNAELFGRFEIPFLLDRTNDDTFDCLMAYPRALFTSAVEADQEVRPDARTVDRYTLAGLENSTPATPTAITADVNIQALVTGLGPHFAFALPFGEMDDPESWFDPSGFGTLEMVLTQGGAGAVVSYFGQQVMP